MCRSDLLTGKKIELRFITQEDTPLVVKWRNLPAVSANLFSQGVLNAEQHERWIQTKVQTGLCHQFIIYDRSLHLPIGSVFIKNIDSQMRKGEYGIFIGVESARGKGFGSEAATLMLRYGFEQLRLNRIYLSVFTDNRAAIASYVHAGFQEEGILKQDFYAHGRFRDVMLMAVLCDEWKKKEGSL